MDALGNEFVVSATQDFTSISDNEVHVPLTANEEMLVAEVDRRRPLQFRIEELEGAQSALPSVGSGGD